MEDVITINYSRDEDIEKYFQFLDHKAISFESISNTIHNMKKNLPDKVRIRCYYW